MRLSRSRGFTMIELMIVMVIVAILLGIAVPGYNNQVRKSRRSEAIAALQSWALAQERWRADNPSYGTAAQVPPPVIPFYTLTVAAAANTFTLTATATGAQTSDTACTPLTLNRAQVKGPLAKCWK